MCAYKQKQAQISSSEEFSDSQGLDKFLNARDTKDEEKILNRAIPKSKLGQELSRNKQGDYGTRGLGVGNYRAGGGMGGAGSYGMGAGSTYGQYNMGYGAHLDYDYDDSYGGGYQMEEEEEERDPYAFDIDIDTKPANKAKGGKPASAGGKAAEKNQEESKYEQRKAALQAKKEKKKQDKLEQDRLEAEEKKRQEELKIAMSKRQTLDVADAYRDDDSDSYKKRPETDYEDESKIEESSLNYEKQLKEYQKALKEMEVMQKKKGSSYGDDSNRNVSGYGKDSSYKFGESSSPLERSMYNIKQGNAEDNNEDVSGSNLMEQKNIKQDVSSSIHSSISHNYEPPKLEIYDATTTNEQLRKSSVDNLEKDPENNKKIDTKESINYNYIKSYPSNREANQGTPDHLNLFLKDSPLKDHRDNINVTPIKAQDGTNIFNTDLKDAGDAYNMLNLPQHYITNNMANNMKNEGRFSGIVVESLLRDEKRHVLMIEEELKMEQKKFSDMKRVADERERSMREMELRLKAAKKDLEETRNDLHKYEKRNVEYQIEVEDLVRQLDLKDVQTAGLMDDVERLKLEIEEKTRMLKEKREFYQKVHESRAVDEIKRQTETEKELLLIDNENMKDELEYLRGAFKKAEESNASLKIALKQKVEGDLQIRSLKQKLLETENKLKEKHEFSRKAQIRTNLVENFDDLNEDEREGLYIDFEKELEVQELLLKGYQKENEKLLLENKALKGKLEKTSEEVFNEQRNLEEMKNKLPGGLVVADYVLKEAENRILQLKDELTEVKVFSNQRETEMKFELDKLREAKKQAESKLAGVDMNKIKQDYSYYNEMESKFKEKSKALETENQDLRQKLNWYIENQENLGKVHEEIIQREGQIKELKETVDKLLNEPGVSQDMKAKHYQNLSSRDQKRVKELEKHVKSLEEGLQKKNPEQLKNLKEKQEENKKLAELKVQNKRLSEDLENKTKDFEIRLVEMQQNYDRMRLEFERRLGENGNPMVKAVGANRQNDKENQMVNFKDETGSLRKRVQELEKELADAKQYYLKKAKNLNKRQPEKRPGSVKDHGHKVNLSPPQQDKKPDEKVDAADKRKPLEGTPKRFLKSSAEKKTKGAKATPSPEKTNKPMEYKDRELDFHLEKLFKFSLTEACPLYIDLWKEVEKIKHCSMNMNIAGMKSLSINLLQEINTNLQNKKLSPKEMEGSFEALRSLCMICENLLERGEEVGAESPGEAFTLFESILRRRLWVNIINSEYNPKLKSNNFINQEKQDEESNNEELTFKCMELEKEAQHLKSLIEALRRNINGLEKEKRDLLAIIERTPKDSKAANQEIMILEKKLEMLEQNYAQKELEINFSLKKLGSPYNIDQNEIFKMKKYFEQEKAELLRIIDGKNKQISEYKIELAGILKELDSLRGN